jgi:hypothetical protein
MRLRSIFGILLTASVAWTAVLVSAQAPPLAKVSAPVAAIVSNAKLVSISAPPTVAAGAAFSATVTVQNTGPETWTVGPTGYKLGSFNDVATWGIGRVELAANVPPGGQATFAINATAPGTGGAFQFQWRMVHEGVAWFGDTATANITVTGGTPVPPTPGPVGGIPIPKVGCCESVLIAALPRAPEVPLPGRVTVWTNTSGQTLYIFQTYLWTGVDVGGVCDTTVHIRKTSTGSIIGLFPWDHYASATGAHGVLTQLQYPCELPPGETLTVTQFGAPSVQTQHTAQIYYTVK